MAKSGVSQIFVAKISVIIPEHDLKFGLQLYLDELFLNICLLCSGDTFFGLFLKGLFQPKNLSGNANNQYYVENCLKSLRLKQYEITDFICDCTIGSSCLYAKECFPYGVFSTSIIVTTMNIKNQV